MGTQLLPSLLPSCSPPLSSATEVARFSNTLEDGPKTDSIPTCLDPELVTINQRGALTVSLVNNMLCVTQNNSQ
jgi:hypothetical protein